MLNIHSFGAGPNLTLLHGWGANNAVWQSWAEQYLAPHFQVHLIELPGYGKSDAIDTAEGLGINAQWLSALQQALPEQTYLLGWSLGGLLAQQLAADYPDQITKLVCVATSPKFCQNDEWPYAVEHKVLEDFKQAVKADALQTLKHFWKLQLQGSDNVRPLMKALLQNMQAQPIPSDSALQQGLDLLEQIDCRLTSAPLSQPTLWLLGENDPLIPANFIDDWQGKNGTIAPHSAIAIMYGAGHMPFYSHPDASAERIVTFLNAE